MSQRNVCPAEYTLKTKLRFLGLGLGLVFWLVLSFVLVVYSAVQNYRWLIFLVVLTAVGLSQSTGKSHG